MSQHTPGPWQIQSSKLGVYYVNPTIEAGSAIEDARHDSIIASCTGFGAFSGIEDDEAQANTQLIAAAPELLAACRQACELPPTAETLHIIEAARAAIAKATGQPVTP